MIGRQGCCLTAEGELNPDVAAYEVSSAISNFLVQSRKFTVLDRSFQGFAEAERNTLKTSENMPVKELAKLGQELFADMILVGNLNSIRLKKAQRKMSTSDRVLEYLAGNIATNIRIIDTATGQIKFSSSLRMNPKDLDLNLGSDIFTISKKVGERVGFTVLNAIYPIQVTGVTEKIVVDLNTGGDVVSVGQVFDLMLLGEKIKDAYTKESLGKRETKIGTVEITQVSPKQSRGKATLINETSNLETTTWRVISVKENDNKTFSKDIRVSLARRTHCPRNKKGSRRRDYQNFRHLHKISRGNNGYPCFKGNGSYLV